MTRPSRPGKVTTFGHTHDRSCAGLHIHRTIGALSIMQSPFLRLAIASVLVASCWLLPARVIGQGEVLLGMSAAFT